MRTPQKDARIYLAIKSREERSRMEDLLVLDGFDASSFDSASRLWDCFQDRPARLIITDRRFGNDMSGLDLARDMRSRFLLPYVYMIILSALNQMWQIEQGLAAGADDYVVKPHNKLQIRSRVLVAFRWLRYVDSLCGQTEPDREEFTGGQPAR